MIALLTIGGGNLFAKTLTVNLSAISSIDGNASWNSETNTFGWTNTHSNAMALPGIPSNMSEYTTVNWTATAGTMNHFRILIYYSNGQAQTTYNPSGDMTGTKSVTFEDMGVVAANLAFISSIKISGASDGTGDIVISSLSFTGPDVVPIEATPVYKAPTGTTNMQDLTGNYPTEGADTWRNKTAYPKELAVQGDAFGNGNGGNESYHVSIDGYDYLSLVITDAQANSAALRVWIWDDVNNSVVTLYAYPEEDYASVENWTAHNGITGPGTYVVKVTGYKHLKGIKADNDYGSPSVTVSYAYLSTGAAPTPYQATGEYTFVGKDNTNSTSMTAALADENAVYYDATGLTGTDIELIPANPNAIFKANEGALANANNVMVGTTIANLVVTDGYPMAVPAGASATAASYTRTMANTYGTVCLPFEVTSDDNYKYYTLGALTADELTLVEATTLPAGTPGVVEKLNGGAMAGSGALANVQAASGTLQLIGTFKPETILASDYPNNIYAISNNQFVQATNDINLPAFRAFFTTSSNESAIRFGFEDEGVTGVNALTGESGVNIIGIYSLDGAAQPSLQKGVNIVKFSDGGVKKIMVK